SCCISPRPETHWRDEGLTTYSWSVTSEQLTAAGVDSAARALEPIVVTTPLEDSPRLSQKVGARVLLKRENRQLARSYKVRGAFYAIQGLDEAERALGVVCASAGNHAQGVAYACARLGIMGRIYVPGNTPRQ